MLEMEAVGQLFSEHWIDEERGVVEWRLGDEFEWVSIDFRFVFGGCEGGHETQLFELSCVFISEALVFLHLL